MSQIWQLAAVVLALALAIGLFVVGAFPMDGLTKNVYVASTLCAFVFIAWFALLDPAERMYARTLYPRTLYLRMKVGAS